MIRNDGRVRKTYVNIACFIPIVCVCVMFYWWIENVTTPSTEFAEPKANKTTLHIGEVLEMEYHVYRWRTCRLEITRILERVGDRREYAIQFVTQQILKDDPVYARPSGYRVQIPVELVTGDYDVYSRVRYYCNGLDFIVPRYLVTERVRIHIDAV